MARRKQRNKKKEVHSMKHIEKCVEDPDRVRRRWADGVRARARGNGTIFSIDEVVGARAYALNIRTGETCETRFRVFHLSWRKVEQLA